MINNKRKRSRKACSPCRSRKRRCDGGFPCRTCTDWGYECYYDAHEKLSTRGSQRSSQTHEALSHSTAEKRSRQADNDWLVRRFEGNSSATFVRKIASAIDPAKTPKLNLFGWNVGARQLSSTTVSTVSALPIHEIASLDHFVAMAHVYFDKVDPCYGFIDRDAFFKGLDERWQYPTGPDIHDSVISGVAALGCLFSQRTATITEMYLAHATKNILDSRHLSGPPCLEFLTGWVLRVIYLRLTDTPHATWIASSTLMHLLEASGFLPESHTVLPCTSQIDRDTQGRLIGVAQHLNTWTSFDLGLSRVSFGKGDTTLAMPPKPGDYTAEILSLLPSSISLDPGEEKDGEELSSTLSQVLESRHIQPPSVLAQCNVVLCILRRMHIQHLALHPSLADKVIALLAKGLDCAKRLALDCSPWHQVANVPFQTLCVLLAIDTPSSLALLAEAMLCLRVVLSHFDTSTMWEAYNTAGLLLLLHQQKRRDNTAALEKAVTVYHEGIQDTGKAPAVSANEDFSFLGALVADMPGLQSIDLEQFLNADLIVESGVMPSFIQ